jgi:two-component sensor histidine kinase
LFTNLRQLYYASISCIYVRNLYSDNGVGLPEDMDSKNTKTLGLDLINTLTQQLDGSIELDRSKGTEFKITFDV